MEYGRQTPLHKGHDREYHAEMGIASYEQRRTVEGLDRAALESLQLAKLNGLMQQILPGNSFYAEKLSACSLPLASLDALRELPFTTKDELVPAAEPGFAANLTFPLSRYSRFHRTSGTRGRPLVVLDTLDDWQWWVETWQFVLDAAEVIPDDRVLMAFSFGPFIGFWTAHDAVLARGALVIAGGGMSSLARLDLIRTHGVTTLLCTPSYAMHLLEIAEQNQIDASKLGVRKIIVAGEPGGSVPAIRDRIERGWRARLTDHAGATEVGPWGYSDAAGRGLRVVESEFIAEFLAPGEVQAARLGELAELVLTALGRAGSPVIRYRTGDLVRPSWTSGEANQFVVLEGGVLGRRDDMLIVRGVNIFPSSIDAILRGFAEITEYRVTVEKSGMLDRMMIEIEDRLGDPTRVARELNVRLGLKVEVREVAVGSLPRFEGKGKRFVDLR